MRRAKALLRRCEITGLGADVHVLVQRLNHDVTEGSIVRGVGGNVSQAVLAAQLAPYLLEILRQFSRFEGKESAPSGLLCQVSQPLIPASLCAGAVRADCEDRHFRALGHGQRLLARAFALIVLAVTD